MVQALDVGHEVLEMGVVVEKVEEEVKVLDEVKAVNVAGAENNINLITIQQQAAKCTLCELYKFRNKAVFARGDVNADVFICGMCPGPEENKIGLPFVGPAGKILDEIIARSLNNKYYITNLVKCFVTPGIKLKQEWCNTCLPYLIIQIKLVNPKGIILLGSDVTQYLLQTDESIGKLRGRIFNYLNIPTICTYHPSYLARGGGIKHKHFERVVNDFRLITNL